MELVALLSTDKGSLGQISGLIRKGEWEKIILIGEENTKKFNQEKKANFITINFNQSLKDLREEFLKKLQNKLRGPEIALSIASGSGKEHMALISALLRLPVGIHFVALTKEGIMEF